MFPSILSVAQGVPAIQVGVNQEASACVKNPVLRQLSSIINNAPVSKQNLETLPEALQLDVSSLDLSDTGGYETGNPDSDPVFAYMSEGGEYYAAYNLTIDGIGADIYITYVDTSWYMCVSTMGGMTWTGEGSANATSPAGTYTTASFSEAGSGFVSLSVF